MFHDYDDWHSTHIVSHKSGSSFHWMWLIQGTKTAEAYTGYKKFSKHLGKFIIKSDEEYWLKCQGHEARTSPIQDYAEGRQDAAKVDDGIGWCLLGPAGRVQLTSHLTEDTERTERRQ